MKKLIRKTLPNRILVTVKLVRNYTEVIRLIVNNFKRFKKYSFKVKQPVYEKQLEALIIKNYHSLEKGLSYQNLRYNFGEDIINKLLSLLTQYKNMGFNVNSFSYTTALSVLGKYIELHEQQNIEEDYLKKEVEKLSLNSESFSNGGVHYLQKQTILEKAKKNFEEMSSSRYSVRDFSSTEVPTDTIIKAIKIAKKTPSACNRQSWKVRIIEDPEKKAILCANQNGNKGFGNQVDKFLLVTTDNSSFSLPREVSQPFIDGGMFAMSLIYALHYQGIATCSLSAALKVSQKKIRDAIGIQHSESIILIIAVGNYIDDFKVPMSSRKLTEDLYEVV